MVGFNARVLPSKVGAVKTTFELQLDSVEIVCCNQGQEDRWTEGVDPIADLTST